MTRLAFILRLIIFKLSSALPRIIMGRPIIALGSAHQPWFSLISCRLEREEKVTKGLKHWVLRRLGISKYCLEFSIS